MSTPSKPDPARGWQFVEKLLLEEELAELEKMSVEEVETELRARGLDPSRVSSAEELVAGAQARAARKNGATTKAGAGQSTANVVPMPVRSKNVRWLTMLAAATLGVLIWMVVAQPFAKRSDVDSALPRSARARAELLRDSATKECAAAQWSACEERLDAAQRLDEEGESEARVVEMRRAIDQATRGDAGAR